MPVSFTLDMGCCLHSIHSTYAYGKLRNLSHPWQVRELLLKHGFRQEGIKGVHVSHISVGHVLLRALPGPWENRGWVRVL